MAMIIIFYAQDGAAAKVRAHELMAGRENHVRVYDVSSWDGSNDACEAVVIMDDVRDWQRKKIEDVYGDRIYNIEEGVEEEELPAPLMTEETTEAAPIERKAVHRGGGRWYVMQGEEQVSGPHNKAEAQAQAQSPP